MYSFIFISNNSANFYHLSLIWLSSTTDYFLQKRLQYRQTFFASHFKTWDAISWIILNLIIWSVEQKSVFNFDDSKSINIIEEAMSFHVKEWLCNYQTSFIQLKRNFWFFINFLFTCDVLNNNTKISYSKYSTRSDYSELCLRLPFPHKFHKTYVYFDTSFWWWLFHQQHIFFHYFYQVNNSYQTLNIYFNI